MCEPRVGTLLAHVARSEIEVVVVKEDRSFGLALELVERRLREDSVDGDVALLPRVCKTGVELRLRFQVPEVVLQEPERGIGDHVVVPVVSRLLVRDEPQAVGSAVAGDLVEGALGGDRSILGRDRARDPRDVVMLDEAAQRRDEPAAAAPRHTCARRVSAVDDGPPVGDDDQLASLAHPPRPVPVRRPTRRGA